MQSFKFSMVLTATVLLGAPAIAQTTDGSVKTIPPVRSNSSSGGAATSGSTSAPVSEPAKGITKNPNAAPGYASQPGSGAGGMSK